MKFRSDTGEPLDLEGLEEEFAQAADLGRVRAGERCLFYPGLGSVRCLPYGRIQQLYLRREEAVANMCCGRVDVSPIFVMAVGTDGRTRKTQIRSREMGQTLLDHVARRAPNIKIGFSKQPR